MSSTEFARSVLVPLPARVGCVVTLSAVDGVRLVGKGDVITRAVVVSVSGALLPRPPGHRFVGGL